MIDLFDLIDRLLDIESGAIAREDDPGNAEILTKIQALLGPKWHMRLKKHMWDMQEQRMGEALQAGLPVFEPGGIVGLANADLAISAARRKP